MVSSVLRHVRFGCSAVIALTALLGGLAVPTASAQGHAPSYLVAKVPDSVRKQRTLHVSPHLLVLDPGRRSATLEFSNTGDKTLSANIAIQLGFTYWQNTDTSFFPTPGKNLRGHDTVIVHPKPSDNYAGDWITGVPEYLVLKPHETKRVTLHINPPASLPDGEYYARIVTMVGSRIKRAAVSKDTATAGTLMFPIAGWELPILRDSVRVFYRKGPQSTGIQIVHAEVKIDTSHSPIEDVGAHPLRMLLRVKRTGTAHFEGNIEVSYLSENHDETFLVGAEGSTISLQRDGIMRWSGETDHLPPGVYHARIRFVGKQDEFPPDQRLPVKPVEVEIPFEVPESATGVDAMPAISTGQGLEGGEYDPYWIHIDGPVDYSRSDALDLEGKPPIVQSQAGAHPAWGMRSYRPTDGINNGWVGSSDASTTEAPLGQNVLRIIVDFSHRKILEDHLAGRWWADDCTDAIYVNGQELTSYEGAGKCGGQGTWLKGFPFTIGAEDGLIDGVNVIDFVYRKTDQGWDGVRIDFRMIFRETHDR